MSDFWWQPLMSGGALLLVGADVTCAIPAPPALTLTGLTPSLKRTYVPQNNQATVNIQRPDWNGIQATPERGWYYTVLPWKAIGAAGNSFKIRVTGKTGGANLIEARMDQIPDTSDTPVWSAEVGTIGIAIRGPAPGTIQDFLTAIQTLGFTGFTPKGLLTDTVLAGSSFAYDSGSISFASGIGTTVDATLTPQTPALNKTAGVPAPPALTLTGLAPALSKTLGIPSATALLLTGLAPGRSNTAPDGTKTLITLRIGDSIGIKIDSGIGE